MNKALIVILAAVTIDAIGIGLIFPILPALLREVAHTGEVATLFGIMLALYSAMQFLFSPVLGVLSDRFGRRPVLLISLAGAAIDYLIMAFAPELWMLVLGRAIAGLTSANMAVATAYITDISAEDERAQRFGYFHAMFGIGFIIGPVLGGVAGRLLGAGAVHRGGCAQCGQFLAGAVRAARIAARRRRGAKFELEHAQSVHPAQMGADLQGADSADGDLRHHEFRRHHVWHRLGAVQRGQLRLDRADDRPVAGRLRLLPCRRAGLPHRAGGGHGWANAGRWSWAWPAS